MNDFPHFLGVLLQGLAPTVGLTVSAIILGTAISFAVGLSLMHRSKFVRFVVRIYVEGWRGTSEMVQLFWIYFALPVLIGLQLIPLWAGIIVLSLNTGAYGAEIVRGAVQAVHPAQFDACVALNLTRTERMMRVILPQAVPEMIPSFNNLYIAVLKGTAIVSLINIHDITYQASQNLLINYPAQTLLIFMMMLAMYLALSVLITTGMRFLERAAARMVGKNTDGRSAKAARTLSTTGGVR